MAADTDSHPSFVPVRSGRYARNAQGGDVVVACLRTALRSESLVGGPGGLLMI